MAIFKWANTRFGGLVGACIVPALGPLGKRNPHTGHGTAQGGLLQAIPSLLGSPERQSET